jgi:putative hydrolase of the HAD superfamily
MRAPRPRLLTFDVFGTILDWRRGTLDAVLRAGGDLPEGRFDEVVDAQGRAEQRTPGRPYREIVAESLVEVAGVSRTAAAEIGAAAGTWPLHPDSAAALARLLRVVPCAATTNSDRAHGEQVRRQLGFHLTHWWCAEDIGCYKPDPRVWEHASRAAGVPFGRDWWHVSAYADYDLGVARRLGLTTVYVDRPHRRPGPADVAIADLAALADLVERVAAP